MNTTPDIALLHALAYLPQPVNRIALVAELGEEDTATSLTSLLLSHRIMARRSATAAITYELTQRGYTQLHIWGTPNLPWPAKHHTTQTLYNHLVTAQQFNSSYTFSPDGARRAHRALINLSDWAAEGTLTTPYAEILTALSIAAGTRTILRILTGQTIAELTRRLLRLEREEFLTSQYFPAEKYLNAGVTHDYPADTLWTITTTGRARVKRSQGLPTEAADALATAAKNVADTGNLTPDRELLDALNWAAKLPDPEKRAAS